MPALKVPVPPASGIQGPAAMTNKKQGILTKYTLKTGSSGAGFTYIAIKITLYYEGGAYEKLENPYLRLIDLSMHEKKFQSIL
jgi:hypothetical protein